MIYFIYLDTFPIKKSEILKIRQLCIYKRPSYDLNVNTMLPIEVIEVFSIVKK